MVNLISMEFPEYIPSEIIVLGDTSDEDCQHLGEIAADYAGNDSVQRITFLGLRSFLLEGDPVAEAVPPEAERILAAAEAAGLNQPGSNKVAATETQTTSRDLVENFAHAVRDQVLFANKEYGVLSHRNRRALWVGKLVMPKATLIDLHIESRPQDEAQARREFIMLQFYRLAMAGVERGNIEDILSRNDLIHELYHKHVAAVPKLALAIGRSLFKRSAPYSARHKSA